MIETCKLCKNEFSGRIGLSKHLLRSHAIRYQDYFDKYIDPNDSHLCPICKINKRKFYAGHYYATCGSNECKSINRKTLSNEHRKYTYLIRYGVEHNSNLVEVKEKRKSTWKSRYGTDYPAQSDIIKDKIKATNLLRRGVTCPFNSDEVKEKIKSTLISRYGTSNLSEIRRNDQFNSKLEIRVYEFIKNIYNGIIKINDRNILTVELLKNYCNINNLDFNNYGWIANHELDFYLPELNLAIEVDGDRWHNISTKSSDELKNSLCKFIGIKLLRIKEYDWYNNNHIVTNNLYHNIREIDMSKLPIIK